MLYAILLFRYPLQKFLVLCIELVLFVVVIL